MPAARSFSPSFNMIVDTARAALQKPEGLSVEFRISKLGSMEACATAARSFQVSFTSLRARARRKNMAAKGQLYDRDHDAFGIYDGLVCQRQRFPDNSGWYVWLGPASAALQDLEIIDNATGERVIIGDDPRAARIQFLMPFVMNRTLTADMWDELEAMTPNWPSTVGMVYPRPGGDPFPPSHECDLAEEDLASEDDDGG